MCYTVQTPQQIVRDVLIVLMILDNIGILGVILIFLYGTGAFDSKGIVAITGQTQKLSLIHHDSFLTDGIILAILVSAAVFFLVDLGMNIYVWIGSSKGDVKICSKWLIYSYTLVALSLTLLVTEVIMLNMSSKDEITTISNFLLIIHTSVQLCLRVYSSNSMKSLITDIRLNPNMYRRLLISELPDPENPDAEYITASG